MTHSNNPKNAIIVRSASELREWLKTNGERDAGVWIVSFKKEHEDFVSYGDIRDEALCFGWVDSKSDAVDENRTAVWLSPRRKGSPWSGVNKERVVVLRRSGRMTSRGERAIEQAKEEGSWSILDDASALIVSDDLAQAMEQAGVRAEYDKLAPSKQRSMLEGIALAKTNKTREARINRIVRECQVSGG
ncbi:hypothetical protein GRI44_13260 [Altererythrobacter confluentis]|uniref:YdeI/OmpD-associated family protein n=1 Tax=Allopontixanthobacter confluentis TaxID=1849021 RepID=A0A6L7GLG7_9SPHN|nr:hypothetical protein [Allopontixanthobacter confluentis]